MSDTTEPRRPRAFRLDPDDGRIHQIEMQPDAYEREAAERHLPEEEIAIEAAQAQGIGRRWWLSWGGIFWSALGSLISLGIGLWTVRLVEDLFARFQIAGWLALVLAGLALLALVAILARETLAVMRQRRIAGMHRAFADARASDDRDEARKLVGDLAALYTGRPTTAKARAHLASLTGEIVDGRDLIDIAERSLMHDLDRQAQREVAQAAKRVSVVTAISPRALIDILFVLGQAVRLIRRISEIYGGRPGLLGFLRLLRSVVTHLAITGGMAAGDSLVEQVIGHGLAARLSARLGEGVLNGLLTARVGISAMAVCRPMPFGAEEAPGVKQVAPFLFGDKAGKPEAG